MHVRNAMSLETLRARGDAVSAAAPMTPTASPKLDFLRTFAVLLVLISHVDKAQGIGWLELSRLAPIGRLGVLLFFVHTSLVLMFSLERHVKSYGHHRLFSTFMIRRIFRIYPLSIAMVLGLMVFQIPGVHVEAHSVEFVGTDATGLIADMLLIQNILISNEGANTLLGPLWSLPLEVQMYVLLPLLFVAIRPIRGTRALLTLWCGSVILAVGSYLAMQVFGMTVASFSWGSIIVPKILVFAPCFLAGILSYKLWPQPGRRFRFKLFPWFLLAIVLLYIGVSNTPGGEHTIDIFGMAVCLAVGLVLPHLAEPANPLVLSVSATVAKYSYGIYLVHVPCIWLGFDVLSSLPIVIQWFVFLGATAVGSFALYHVVEQPFISVGARVGRRWAQGSFRARAHQRSLSGADVS